MTENIDRTDELREWYAEDDVNGAELLDELVDVLTRYVVFPDRHAGSAPGLVDS